MGEAKRRRLEKMKEGLSLQEADSAIRNEAGAKGRIRNAPVERMVGIRWHSTYIDTVTTTDKDNNKVTKPVIRTQTYRKGAEDKALDVKL